MLNFIFLQSAAAQQEGAPSMLPNIIMIVALVAVFYFFMIRPQQKRQKQMKEFRSALGKGSKVMTSGGIYGTIADTKESTFIVQIAKEVKIEVDKTAVFPVNTPAEALKEGQASN